jgi:RNA polymerase sigma-70 factor (ECF subfamily)
LRAIEERLRSLMLQSLAGESAATRDLLLALATQLRGYFSRRMGDGAADVDDLVQETLLAVHVRRETYDPDQLLTGWVFAIARHKLIDWYRRRSARPTVPLDGAAELFAEDACDGATAGDDVGLLLGELPANQATAIRCMKLEGLSAAQTASRTGQSVPAVKVGVHRGMRALVARLRGERE